MQEKIVIIDYGMGNLNSIKKAFKRIGFEANISSKKEDILQANKLILPGVGHFKKAMENLNSLGLIEILNKKVLREKTPILGICLGMQLLTKFSEEGEVNGLGWIDAKTIKFEKMEKFKIPHMGWNSINIKKKSKMFDGIKDQSSFYFVHSYYLKCNNLRDVLSETIYGKKFTSSIEKGNIFGMQFHPEKSHKEGLKILFNFVKNV